MSAGEPTTTEPAASDANPRGGLLGTDQLLYALLALLSLVGMGVADFSASYGLWYWLVMVPLFGGACVYVVWDGARARGESRSSILWRAYLHWSVLPLAMYVIYALESTGRLNREDAGLVALLSLAITTLLAGVHFDWRLAFLGAILAGTSVAAALVEEFFWAGLIPAVALGALAVWRRRA